MNLALEYWNSTLKSFKTLFVFLLDDFYGLVKTFYKLVSISSRDAEFSLSGAMNFLAETAYGALVFLMLFKW